MCRVIGVLLLTGSAVALAGKGLVGLKNSLGVLGLTVSLVAVSPADDIDRFWQRVTDKSPTTGRSTFLLDIELATHNREMPLIMVGRDRLDRHLFVGARVYVTDLPLLDRPIILDDAQSLKLYAYDGLIASNFVISEIETFFRPDNSLSRSYDLSVLAIEGLDELDGYPASRTAEFPPLMTSLELVVYEPGGRGWRAYRRHCRARRSIDQWLAVTDCVVPLLDNRFVDIGTPIFNNRAGKLIGLQLEPGDAELPVMIVIPEELEIFLDLRLAVEASDRLPTTWGKIKANHR